MKQQSSKSKKVVYKCLDKTRKKDGVCKHPILIDFGY